MALYGYLLTWHTYGTWLHGDARGSVNKAQNIPGTPFVPPNDKSVRIMASRMKQAPFTFDTPMRSIVDQAIRDHSEIRRWHLFELNVRSNHVHVVIGPSLTHDADEMTKQLKSWGTRRLIKHGFATSQTRVWVDHGSTRHLNSEHSLQRAIEYVQNQ